MRLLGLLTAITVLIVSCNKDNIDKTASEITLIYPVNDTIVNPCCTNFQWSTVLKTDFQLTVATNDTFNDPLIDTLLPFSATDSIAQFLHSFTFEPGVKHYWRIRQDSVEKTSSFLIRNIINGFKGNQAVQINKSYWGAAQGVDTSLSGTIEIKTNPRGVEVNYPEDNLYRVFEFFPIVSSNKVYYTSYGTSIASFCEVYLNYLNDSIQVHYSDGSPGGRVIWDMEGKK